MRGGDLCLRASCDVSLPGSACGSVPTLSSAHELNQRSGSNRTELVKTGGLESANE